MPGLPADDGGLRDLAFGDEPGALADQCLLEDPDLRQDRGGSRSAGVRREQAPRVAVVPAAVGDGDPLETRPERGAVPGSAGVAGGGVQGLPHEDQRLGGVAGVVVALGRGAHPDEDRAAPGRHDVEGRRC